jgi:hypothetical protein
LVREEEKKRLAACCVALRVLHGLYTRTHISLLSQSRTRGFFLDWRGRRRDEIDPRAGAGAAAGDADEIDPLDLLHSFVRVFFSGGGP